MIYKNNNESKLKQSKQLNNNYKIENIRKNKHTEILCIQ